MRREPTFEQIEDADEMRLLPRPRPLGRVRLAARFVFAAAIIAGLTVAARDRMRTAPVADASRTTDLALVPERASVAKERPLLRLDPADGEIAAIAEPPRWSPATGQREDTIAGGRFDAIEAPFLRVTLNEAVEDSGAGSSLFVTLVRRTGEMERLSVTRAGLRGRIETKFGPFEIVDTTLAGTGQRACLGFRSLAGGRTQLDGWLCGVLGQAPEPQAVACLMDRLGIAGPADPVIEAVFMQAQSRRGTGCIRADTVEAREADKTGSIGRRSDAAKGRSWKNEAGMRQND